MYRVEEEEEQEEEEDLERVKREDRDRRQRQSNRERLREMVWLVSKMIKWLMPSKVRHGEKN